MTEDEYGICCNITEGTHIFSAGAKCWIINMNRDNACERMFLYGRSRGGRFVEIWQPLKNLKGFRPKWITIYVKDKLGVYGTREEMVESVSEINEMVEYHDSNIRT